MSRGWDANSRQSRGMTLRGAHQNRDEKAAYNIVKAVFDHKEELVRVHKEAENFKLENQKKEASPIPRSEEHTSELQSQSNLVCRLLLEKKKNTEHHPVHAPTRASMTVCTLV